MTEDYKTMSWKQLVEKIKVLQETIDKLKLEQAVAAQLPGNPHLKTASARTQTYQTPGSEVGVDIEFAAHMFWKGVAFQSESEYADMDGDDVCHDEIEAYKAQQTDSPAIDNNSD